MLVEDHSAGVIGSAADARGVLFGKIDEHPLVAHRSLGGQVEEQHSETASFRDAQVFPIGRYGQSAGECQPRRDATHKPAVHVKPIHGADGFLLAGVLRIGMPIVALAIIYCGFLFVQAGGNPESIEKAKEALLYTIIGAAILLGSWAIASIISNTILVL